MIVLNVKEMMADLPLAELLQARSLSQEEPAAILEVQQQFKALFHAVIHPLYCSGLADRDVSNW